MSAWKPKKEKALTLDEALELARQQFAPFWYNSTPLLAPTRAENKTLVFPLEKSFVEKKWIVFAIDPTTYGGEGALAYLKEWMRRYSPMDFEFLLALRLPSATLKNERWIKAFLRRYQFAYPAVLDADGALFGGLGASAPPKVLVFHEGKIALESEGDLSSEVWQETESRLQKFLWTVDPGAPMLPIYVPSPRPSFDVQILETGRQLSLDASAHAALASYPAPGFPGGGTGLVASTFPPKSSGASADGRLELHGTWLQDAERLVTQDPAAWVEFRCVGRRLGLLAQTLNTENKPVRVVVEYEGKSVYEAVAGDAITLDDDGKSLVRVDSLQLYHVLDHLPSEGQRVRLSFQNVDRCPIAIFGVRFGS